ncbi:glutathione synthase [Pantoea sp. Mhis]|uniref:glutathione synthase n=1 Tax=Pantoea sp. Mhis TaxID=2576759 RepID=UPI0013573165|nr:glutathione synthase [Pantoea sp. Mhis]MXP56688.1 glutathione synthase [Pantoea sp. Mhis]
MIKLGIIMDPISSINIKKDTSFAILLEAQRCDFKIYYMEINDLSLRGNVVYAHTYRLYVEKNDNKWYEFYNEQEIKLVELDIILIRKDPPFNTKFLYITYLLEYAEQKGTLIINKPQSLRDCNEKIFTTWFPELIPDMLVTCNQREIHAFWQKYGDIIVKPLDGMGGKSIFRIKEDDQNFGVITETLTNYGQSFCIVQNYLPAIKEGDKRILIIDGKPVPYCLVRIPQEGETRANLAVGGYGEARALSDKDWEIALRVAPILKSKGLIFVGLDIIGDKLTEINITSPTCICEIEATFPISISGILIDAIKNLLR